ncbi:MAG: sigma 54-dependent Fis family transcriptional regulator [Polyangiales bacterium]
MHDDERTMTVPGLRPQGPPTRFVEVISPGNPSPFRAREGIVRLGRDAGNEVVIEDPFVSRVHLEIRIFPSGVTAVDLDTKNGTHHQGARIRELPITGEVSLRLGKQVDITVRVGDDATRPAAPAPVAPRHRRDSADLVGASPSMERLRAAVARIAPSPLTVLIEGETGTGKEVLARALHAQSTRSAKPFVVFDCAAVSPSLIASELFGHRKGAFTGAVGDNDGAFRRADGGTIFLDEIGELPLELQPALLRALEAREVRPVGDNTYKHVNVRVLAATNRSLEAEVAAGRFRQDLLFRLKVGILKLPPLRQRPEDIPVLARHFARGLGASLSDEVVLRLQLRRWPGNVRELRNVIERAVMLAGSAPVTVDLIEDDDRDVDPRATLPGPEAAPSMRVVDGKRLLDMSFQDAKQYAVENFEKDYLMRLFEESGYNLSEAARRSGVDRRYLRELFKKHGMEPAALRAQRRDDEA